MLFQSWITAGTAASQGSVCRHAEYFLSMDISVSMVS